MPMSGRFITALLAILFGTCVAWVNEIDRAEADGRGDSAGFAGLEFYGSSQITRLDLEKYLGLKPGARLEPVTHAVDRLNKKLAERHIASCVEIVQGNPQEIYVVVGVDDSSTSGPPPTRHLRDPHHVQLSTDKPLLLLNDLDARLDQLSNEGRHWSEEFRSGLKYFSDEPASQIADQLVQLVPMMRSELLSVTQSDPDPARRRKAVELLNWAGSVPETAARLLPLMDDADPQVRAAVARYLFARFEMLPGEFPYGPMVQGFSRMLDRSTHQDRSKALWCLLGLCRLHPELIEGTRSLDEDKVKRLAGASIIPSVKKAAVQLDAMFSNPPKLPQRVTEERGGGDASGF